MNNSYELQQLQQRSLVRSALRAWLPAIKADSNPRLINATLTGDVLWNDEHMHIWIGIHLEWFGSAEVMQAIVNDGEIVSASSQTCEGEFEEYVFMRVFEDLAEFDQMSKSTDPAAMYGLRQADGLEGIHEYYKENS